MKFSYSFLGFLNARLLQEFVKILEQTGVFDCITGPGHSGAEL